jgi:FKBP-type peptidyl-prolyl cis-trans isomerase FkpA
MTFRPALAALGLAASLVACEPQGDPSATASASAPAGAPGLESEEARTLYAMGAILARGVAGLDLSEEELAALQAGLSDGALGREPQVPLDEYRQQIQNLTTERRAAAASVEKEAGQAFLLEAAAAEGAEQLDSGLVIRTLSPGEGASPAATDEVRVHYHGTLRDGTVFDSSVVRGQPAVFPLNRVIPCWTEGLQRMKVGQKAQLVCPPEIAYGDRGSPPRIPPGATLAFEVELIEVVSAAGAGEGD